MVASLGTTRAGGGGDHQTKMARDTDNVTRVTQGGAMALAPESLLSVIMGETRLLDAFEVMDSDTEPVVGGRVLRLIPRRPQEDFEEAEIEVLPDGQVMRVSLLDRCVSRGVFGHRGERSACCRRGS